MRLFLLIFALFALSYLSGLEPQQQVTKVSQAPELMVYQVATGDSFKDAMNPQWSHDHMVLVPLLSAGYILVSGKIIQIMSL